MEFKVIKTTGKFINDINFKYIGVDECTGDCVHSVEINTLEELIEVCDRYDTSIVFNRHRIEIIDGYRE